MERNGLLRHSAKYFRPSAGFYGLTSIFLLLGFLALGRLRSIEALRYYAPGEWANCWASTALQGRSRLARHRQAIFLLLPVFVWVILAALVASIAFWMVLSFSPSVLATPDQRVGVNHRRLIGCERAWSGRSGATR